MRCHDCGEIFIRWDAFKTHLRMHVLEDEEEERRLLSMKTQTESKGKSYKEPKGQKIIKLCDETEVELKTEAWSGENSDVDVDGLAEDHDEEVLECFRKSPSKLVRVDSGIMTPVKSKPFFTQSQKVYACGICGKVYSYMESFRNHQKKHEVINKGHQEHVCPNCGKSFARPALLMAHLKVHKPSAEQEINTLKCDQCNKHFNSLQTWMIHIDLHKQKPFWCLTCAKGFRDEVLLDKHLQGHNLRRHKCNICSKTFRVPAELRYHYNTHTGAKPYRCNLCKKNFSQLGNLITHRKKHVGVYVGTSKTPLGEKINTYSRRRVTELKRLIFDRVGNEDEIETGEEEEASLGDKGKEIIGYYDAKEDSEISGGKEYCFEQQCPNLSNSDSSGSSEASSSGVSESELSDTESEPKEKQVPKKVLPISSPLEKEQSKHWEWECFECDLGFAKEAELHMHYMKHASGELPIL